jgi:hypothetical protein
MSDQPFSDDELLSSHLDGELTAEEMARLGERLATEPELRDRLEALRSAEELAATAVVPLAADDADRMILAALDASTTADNVTDLSAARKQNRFARYAAVAAGVIGLAIAVSALRSIDGENSDTAGTADDATTSAVSEDDMALEAMLDEESAFADEAADGNDSADTAGADDMTEDDMAEDDMAEAPEAESARGYTGAQSRLFLADDGFDPLADDLGAFVSEAQLRQSVSEQLTAFQTSPTTTLSTGDDGPADLLPDDVLDEAEFLELSRSRLAEVGLGACPEVVDAIIDYFADDEVVAADYAVASVDGDDVTIGLYQVLGQQASAVALVIDQATCDIRVVPLG